MLVQSLEISIVSWLAIFCRPLVVGIALLYGFNNGPVCAYKPSNDELPINSVVVIELDSQREVYGKLLPETNKEYVWLLRKESSVRLASGFPWTKVVSYRTFNDDPNREHENAEALTVGSISKEPGEAIHQDSQLPCLEESSTSPIASSTHKVRSLEIYASVANWDGDPEVDGIEVLVRPIDAWGNTVASRGQIDFELLGQRQPRNLREPIHVGRRYPERFGSLATWSRVVRPSQIGLEGVVYQLEFRNFQPYRDLVVNTETILSARLGVPSQGVFEASSHSLPIRSFSPLRDNLQHRTGSRHFEQEQVLRGSNPSYNAF